jgi:hypothetical protein
LCDSRGLILTAQLRHTDHTTLVLLQLVIATSAAFAKPAAHPKLPIKGIFQSDPAD